MGNNEQIREYIKAMVNRHQYSLIPLRFVTEGGVKNGKVPAIRDYNKYFDELPTDEEIDAWHIIGEVSGVGLCCGRASNIVCVDIDSEDPEINRRIDSILPSDAVKIVGNPNRGGKYLFRLFDFDTDPDPDFTKMSFGKGMAGQTKNFVDVFATVQQIALPPTIHSIDLKTDVKTKYSWGDSRIKEGEYPQKQYLPLFSTDYIEAIRHTLNGEFPSQVAQSFPAGTIELNKGESNGRWAYMTKEMSDLQRKRVSIDEAIRTLVNIDKTRHGVENMALMEKTKISQSPILNCTKWYLEMLLKNNAHKPIPEMEIPYTLSEESRIIEANHSDWLEPDLPDNSDIAVDPFATAIIPEIWKDLVLDVSNSMSVPAEACFFILLTQLSSLIGNKKLISGKINNKGWKEAHNIYTVYISKSGTRKTPMLRVLAEPMRRLQKHIDSDYREAMIEHAKIKEVTDPQIKELEQRLRQESITALDTDNANEHEVERIQLQLSQLRQLAEEPRRKQLVVNSATTEKLHDIMSINETGTMIVYNEISGLMNQFKKQGYENHRELIMNGWDGLDSHVHQTRGSGDSIIEKACLSLYGAIQPSLFKENINEIYNNKNDDGFWQRPFIVFNDSKGFSDGIDIEFDPEKYFKSYEVFYKAYELAESDEPVRVSYEVRDMLLDFETEMNRMAYHENSDAISSFWGKFTGKIVKMASLLQFIKNEGEFINEISVESAKDAIYIMERQVKHIRNVFPKDAVAGLSEVVDMMQSGIIQSGMTMYQLQRSHKKYFGEEKAKNALMRELSNRNIIRANKEGSSLKIEISPYVF